MAWFRFTRIRTLLDWIWITLGWIWRGSKRRIGLLVGNWPLAIRFGRSQSESERNEEDKVTEKSDQVEEEEVEEEEEEAQHTGRRLSEEEEEEEEECRVETTDELFSRYDSTWETDDQQEETVRSSRRPGAARLTCPQHKFSRFQSAARDMHNYRHNYQLQTRQHHWEPRPNHRDNLSFYHGRIPSVPDGVLIHDFHNKWFRQYDRLESVHSYIQWLFPLQEPGMNAHARTLTEDEIQEFRQSSIAQANLLKSYKLMLDFYGIRLSDEKTGRVTRAPNWRDRFNNLNRHSHNNLRITRILKCQGTLGLDHYQAPLVRFFLKETLVHGELPNVKDSALNYFLFAVRDKRQRRRLIKFAYLHYERKDEFVWCPKKVQVMWSRQKQEVSRKKEACELQLSPHVYSEDEDD